ncbi:hypothetical protein PTNB73_09039 [Pyrenophora teres f. teres]|nr:hypothetical protein PTNB73_09039 [Pyrenophora teres f. teres]
MRQTFVNQSEDTLIEIRYAFPLFDGVSVVDFMCQVGERTIYGLVKERREARKTYDKAKERGETAALLEQLPDAADVFTTTISNIANGSFIFITIKYIQELKHDAEVDGIRLTIPSSISPRYGDYPGNLQERFRMVDTQGISITVDVSIPEGIPIRKMISPSHPIEVTLGSLSTSTIDEDVSLSKGSAILSLGKMEIRKDFVLEVVAKDIGIPQAILETHSTLPNQRALMTTLVPKFNLKDQKPEIIFIVDRSGSMYEHIPTLLSALKVFLKSIPIGCMFNICSFRTHHSFLWDWSKAYTQEILEKAIDALIEGVARAGRGFAQMVTENKKLDSKIVRMLKGALTTHIKDYSLEVRYEDDSIESVTESLRVHLNIDDADKDNKNPEEELNAEPISLYDTAFQEEHPKAGEPIDIFAGLLSLKRPALVQTSHEIPQLFPFHRTSIYLLLAPELSHLKPQSVVLKEADKVIYQLAACKATQELEEGHS